MKTRILEASEQYPYASPMAMGPMMPDRRLSAREGFGLYDVMRSSAR